MTTADVCTICGKPRNGEAVLPTVGGRMHRRHAHGGHKPTKRNTKPR